MSISNRELYKKLKKHKVFSKFYICCAKVFNGDSLCGYKHFLEESVKQDMLMDEQQFVRGIKSWSMGPPYVRIMYKQE